MGNVHYFVSRNYILESYYLDIRRIRWDPELYFSPTKKTTTVGETAHNLEAVGFCGPGCPVYAIR